jgi:hypothetical protein
LGLKGLAERIAELGHRPVPETRRAGRVSLADAHLRALDTVGRQRRARKPTQQRHELRQRERPLDECVRLDDGGHYVLPLEAEHEIERLQIDACQVAGRVTGEVEAELVRDRDRLRQRRLRAEIQGSERDDPQRQALGVAGQQRRGEGAAEAVASAHEGHLQLSQDAPRS